MRYPLLDINMNMRTAEVAKDHVVSYVLEPYENKPSSFLVKEVAHYIDTDQVMYIEDC